MDSFTQADVRWSIELIYDGQLAMIVFEKLQTIPNKKLRKIPNKKIIKKYTNDIRLSLNARLNVRS